MRSARRSPPVTRGVPLATRVSPLRLTEAGDPHRFRGNNAAVTGLTELQFDRFREVAGLNRLSVSVGEVIVRLQSGEPAVRASAAQRLALWRTPAAAPALALRLADSVREVRVAAAFALAPAARASLSPRCWASRPILIPWSGKPPRSLWRTSPGTWRQATG